VRLALLSGGTGGARIATGPAAILPPETDDRVELISAGTRLADGFGVALAIDEVVKVGVVLATPTS
jgi:hypothetical protein